MEAVKTTPKKSRPLSINRRCKLCTQGIDYVDYKDVEFLKKFITYNGKISPRRFTGCCAKHQKAIANAIKKARIVALLPFVKSEN
jgi:small subunit ribosomal protein S18